jgi:hypothetical protein
MLFARIFIPGFLLISSHVASAAWVIDVDFERSGQLFDDGGCAAGWKWFVTDPKYPEERACKFMARFTTTKLPYVLQKDPFTLAINANGKIDLRIEVGDADASASSSMALPVELLNRAVGPEQAVILNVKGGDHASGSWRGEGTMRLFRKP